MPLYKKLVRDKIPQIIESKGETCVFEILDNDNYVIELRKKLDEEIIEYMKAGNLEEATEELADVLEVIHAYAAVHGVSIEGAETKRIKKAAERGGFAKRVFLVEVVD
ncbi:phosphoribosyl-ATP pyrophosphohydrolase [Paenibacillus sp. LMG 31456]|uniref:Phosphoribosyl-ATP pyrophosphohydrolase n=1 Tax=Paenibacillus foliorum TaxID=2654974 RepID=A0A972GY54_9BACL|nr:nucleoside triphosphate pyrophosphohydrolase [Paenibacillus foliorum]NOU92701.1 phosphoribosyl-ATP pyrophosphohydrolase [Paenibacillus foliorum]